jgi:hypothetical protein
MALTRLKKVCKDKRSSLFRKGRGKAYNFETWPNVIKIFVHNLRMFLTSYSICN